MWYIDRKSKLGSKSRIVRAKHVERGNMWELIQPTIVRQMVYDYGDISMTIIILMNTCITSILVS